MKICVDNEGDLVESNLSFIREVPMVLVNLIIVVVIVSDRKKGSNTLVPPLVILGNNDSAVYILTRQPTGESGFRFPADLIIFSLPQSVQTDLGPTQLPIQLVLRVLSHRVTRKEREVNH